VQIRAEGFRVTNWQIEQNSAGPIPQNLELNPVPDQITLVPYGCARLRIAEFPLAAKTTAAK
jgi:hypothetical protein